MIRMTTAPTGAGTQAKKTSNPRSTLSLMFSTANTLSEELLFRHCWTEHVPYPALNACNRCERTHIGRKRDAYARRVTPLPHRADRSNTTRREHHGNTRHNGRGSPQRGVSAKGYTTRGDQALVPDHRVLGDGRSDRRRARGRMAGRQLRRTPCVDAGGGRSDRLHGQPRPGEERERPSRERRRPDIAPSYAVS